MEKNYLGCDPGLNGGFVLISGDQIRCKLAMPLISTITEEGKKKKELDQNGILSFLSTLPPYTHVVIEEQIPVRNQHIQASHTTAKNYGILLMGFTATLMIITEVKPDVWQSHFGIISVKKADGRSTKEQALEVVKRIYPDTDFRKSDRSHKAHDGVVDATLIANFCQFLFEGEEKWEIE